MAYLGKSIETKTVVDSGVKAQAPATFDSLVSDLATSEETVESAS